MKILCSVVCMCVLVVGIGIFAGAKKLDTQATLVDDGSTHETTPGGTHDQLWCTLDWSTMRYVDDFEWRASLYVNRWAVVGSTWYESWDRLDSNQAWFLDDDDIQGQTDHSFVLYCSATDAGFPDPPSGYHQATAHRDGTEASQPDNKGIYGVRVVFEVWNECLSEWNVTELDAPDDLYIDMHHPAE